MAGPILRMPDMVKRTGLSRSVIYERQDKKSPRYAEDFPKSFSLGGTAVGWFENEVDAWLEKCARSPKDSVPSKRVKPDLDATGVAAKSTSKPVSQRALAPRQTPKRPTSHVLHKPAARSGNLAETIVEGGNINNRLLDYLHMPSWTPAMGVLLVCGIEPPPDCIDIPDGGIGLDEKPLHPSNDRFNEARRLYRDWQEWNAEQDNPTITFDPVLFFHWCMDENVNTEWFRLMLKLIEFTDGNEVDLTGARFALLTNR